MSLTALAVVNRNGTPLYLRDYTNTNDRIFNFTACNNDSNNINSTANDDLFDDEIFTDYEETTSKQMSEWPCQLQYQFILNSAHEKLDEVLRGNRWRTPGATEMEANWVGLLCLSGNFRAYGEYGMVQRWWCAFFLGGGGDWVHRNSFHLCSCLNSYYYAYRLFLYRICLYKHKICRPRWRFYCSREYTSAKITWPWAVSINGMFHILLISNFAQAMNDRT